MAPGGQFRAQKGKKNGLDVQHPTSLTDQCRTVTPCSPILSLTLAPDPRATISSRTKSRLRYEHALVLL